MKKRRKKKDAASHTERCTWPFCCCQQFHLLLTWMLLCLMWPNLTFVLCILQCVILCTSHLSLQWASECKKRHCISSLTHCLLVRSNFSLALTVLRFCVTSALERRPEALEWTCNPFYLFFASHCKESLSLSLSLAAKRARFFFLSLSLVSSDGTQVEHLDSHKCNCVKLLEAEESDTHSKSMIDE